MECSLPGSFVHGIFQARILKWVAISFSREIFLTQGLSPCLLHWQMGSLPLASPWKPHSWHTTLYYFQVYCIRIPSLYKLRNDDHSMPSWHPLLYTVRNSFCVCWELLRSALLSKCVYYLGWNRSPAQVGCMRQVLGPGALGRPREIGWRGRWEGGIGMGNTCKSMDDSFQCMTKPTTIL